MKRLAWAIPIAVAAFGVACNGTQGSGSRSPAAPSAANDQGSTAGGTAAQAAALSQACGFGDGGDMTNGTPPPGSPPPEDHKGPGGQAPTGPAPPGSQLALTGPAEHVAGSCPAISFTIAGNTVQTNAATSFATGSCSSLKTGAGVGIVGTAQADGSILASCVASGF
jgi:Domain of unknown function (DUF5666)